MAQHAYDYQIKELAWASPSNQHRWLVNNLDRLEELTERQQQVLVKRFGLGTGQMMTGAETAIQLGISKTRVYEVIREAFIRMARIDPLPEPERMPSKEPMVDELYMSPRTTNRLLSAGILTIHDLCNCTAQQLLEIPNFGKASLEEVRHTLAQHGGKKLRAK